MSAALLSAAPTVAQDRATRGVVVESVTPGSAGQRAGVQPGDVLTAWERSGSAGQPSARGTLGSPFALSEEWRSSKRRAETSRYEERAPASG